MAQRNTRPPQGAGATTSGNSSETASFGRDEQESGRAVIVAERPSARPSTATVVGAALAGAIAGGAIPFLLSGRSSSGGRSSDETEVEASITIDRPARELYDFWRDFTNLAQFMDNVKSVEKLGDKRSHWEIKAPAGTSVEFDSRVTEDVPGKLIAWESEAGASVPNRGRVEFNELAGGRTQVRARISYDPPAGAAGRLVAKLFQREPAVQAREDLARFKDVMEGRRAG